MSLRQDKIVLTKPKRNVRRFIRSKHSINTGQAKNTVKLINQITLPHFIHYYSITIVGIQYLYFIGSLLHPITQRRCACREY